MAHARTLGRRESKGFTLIEMMIVVGVVAILGARALPADSDYVRRGKIPEATTGLSQGRVGLEQWFQDNRSYAGGPCPGDTKNFTFACNTGATTFDITATGLGDMAVFSYTIDQSNARTSATPWGNGATCWIARKGDSC